MKRNLKAVFGSILIVMTLVIFSGCTLEIIDATSEEKNIVVDGKLEVHFIDVGQADSILIKIPSGESMLIDAGKNGDSKFIDSYLKDQGIQVIDIAIGTHPHEDHIGSLDTVINNFDVKKVYMPKVAHTSKTFEDVLLAIKNKGLKVSTPVAGDIFNLGEAKFTVLAPNNSGYESFNNYSIVLKLEYGNTSFLFTGDSEVKSEKEMIEKGYDLSADVLKVGHHGSTTSTSNEFLNAVSPKYAVISSEIDNYYGHPHKEIIEKLKQNGIPIFRTDQAGTIVCTSNGENIIFSEKSDEGTNDNDKNDIEINSEIIISNIDKKGELVTIKNNSSVNVNLEGWKLVSIKGNQELILPNYNLKPGGTVTVTSGDLKGEITWGSTNIWNNTESDPGELYDNNGILIYKYED